MLHKKSIKSKHEIINTSAQCLRVILFIHTIASVISSFSFASRIFLIEGNLYPEGIRVTEHLTNCILLLLFH